MRHRDLGEAGLGREFGEPDLVGRVAIAVHQHDRYRPKAPPDCGVQRAARGALVECPDHGAVGREPLVDLDHLPVQRFG